MTASGGERPTVAATVNHSNPAATANGVARGGGQLTREFPHKLTGWIDADLANAIALASSIERERGAVIVRRWLRFAARQSGYYRDKANQESAHV